jgi:hypothetical protein
MQRRIFRARFLTLFSVLALVPSCSRDHGAPVRDLKLGLSILTDAHEYPMRGVLRLDTRLMNPGADTVYVFDDFCWNPGNLLNIHAFDISGKEVYGHSDVLRDCLPPPPAPGDTSRFHKLEPGSFDSIVENFDIRGLVPGPGAYDIVVHYHTALSKDWVAKYGGRTLVSLPIWTSEYPELVSNRLHIIVSP